MLAVLGAGVLRLDATLGARLGTALGARLGIFSPLTEPTLDAILMRLETERVAAGGSSVDGRKSAMVRRRLALDSTREETLSLSESLSTYDATGFLPRNCLPDGSIRTEDSVGSGFSFLTLGAANSSGLQL